VKVASGDGDASAAVDSGVDQRVVDVTVSSPVDDSASTNADSAAIDAVGLVNGDAEAGDWSMRVEPAGACSGGDTDLAELANNGVNQTVHVDSIQHLPDSTTTTTVTATTVDAAAAADDDDNDDDVASLTVEDSVVYAVPYSAHSTVVVVPVDTTTTAATSGDQNGCSWPDNVDDASAATVVPLPKRKSWAGVDTDERQVDEPLTSQLATSEIPSSCNVDEEESSVTLPLPLRQQHDSVPTVVDVDARIDKADDDEMVIPLPRRRSQSPHDAVLLDASSTATDTYTVVVLHGSDDPSPCTAEQTATDSATVVCIDVPTVATASTADTCVLDDRATVQVKDTSPLEHISPTVGADVVVDTVGDDVEVRLNKDVDVVVPLPRRRHQSPHHADTSDLPGAGSTETDSDAGRHGTDMPPPSTAKHITSIVCVHVPTVASASPAVTDEIEDKVTAQIKDTPPREHISPPADADVVDVTVADGLTASNGVEDDELRHRDGVTSPDDAVIVTQVSPPVEVMTESSLVENIAAKRLADNDAGSMSDDSFSPVTRCYVQSYPDSFEPARVDVLASTDEKRLDEATGDDDDDDDDDEKLNQSTDRNDVADTFDFGTGVAVVAAATAAAADDGNRPNTAGVILLNTKPVASDDGNPDMHVAVAVTSNIDVNVTSQYLDDVHTEAALPDDDNSSHQTSSTHTAHDVRGITTTDIFADNEEPRISTDNSPSCVHGVADDVGTGANIELKASDIQPLQHDSHDLMTTDEPLVSVLLPRRKDIEHSVMESGETVTDQPVIDQPVIDQPVANQLVTNQSVTDQPMTVQPVTYQTVIDQLVTDEPVIDQRVTDQLVTDQPVIDQLVIDQLVTDQPLTDQPVIDQPVIDQPLSDQPVIGQPVIDQLVIDQLVTDQPLTDQPVIDQPVIDQPLSDQPVIGQPVIDQLIIDQPITVQPVTDKPVIDQPLSDQPVIGQPVIDQLVIDQLVTDQPAIDQLVINQPITVQPVNDQTVIDQPVSDQRVIDQPVIDRPVTSTTTNTADTDTNDSQDKRSVVIISDPPQNKEREIESRLAERSQSKPRDSVNSENERSPRVMTLRHSFEQSPPLQRCAGLERAEADADVVVDVRSTDSDNRCVDDAVKQSAQPSLLISSSDHQAMTDNSGKVVVKLDNYDSKVATSRHAEFDVPVPHLAVAGSSAERRVSTETSAQERPPNAAKLTQVLHPQGPGYKDWIRQITTKSSVTKPLQDDNNNDDDYRPRKPGVKFARASELARHFERLTAAAATSTTTCKSSTNTPAPSTTTTTADATTTVDTTTKLDTTTITDATTTTDTTTTTVTTTTDDTTTTAQAKKDANDKRGDVTRRMTFNDVESTARPVQVSLHRRPTNQTATAPQPVPADAALHRERRTPSVLNAKSVVLIPKASSRQATGDDQKTSENSRTKTERPAADSDDLGVSKQPANDEQIASGTAEHGWTQSDSISSVDRQKQSEAGGSMVEELSEVEQAGGEVESDKSLVTTEEDELSRVRANLRTRHVRPPSTSRHFSASVKR